MRIVQNRKAWRNEIVSKLITNGRSAHDAINEAKKIEEYVFQNDFIIEIEDENQKNTLKAFIKTIEQKESVKNT
ncbi:hypothetical protein [Acinetobacter soli]|uniref:hypothetical protein n=1 Tax=Acinetobacter soli TaxID=487316 RepID=UPI002FEEE6C9